MAIHTILIDDFQRLATKYPVLDVRSPGEYTHAHIPGAHSLPLFTDAERAEIGTAYKHASREAAIKIGLSAFGPRMKDMVECVEAILKQQISSGSDGQVLVHCWRGGMRSAAVAWLLDLYGYSVRLLEGGYKAYRRWVIGHWQDSGPYRVLTGNTGAGKTDILASLESLGAPVIDLEALAGHKGSAFGNLDQIPQPSQEMFENLLATRIAQLRAQFGASAIWIEDESQRIGNLNIPTEFFRKLFMTEKAFIDAPFETRLDAVLKQYGSYSTERLVNAIIRIKKRLGPLETKTAVNLLLDGDVRQCFAILLLYYDKHYGLHGKKGVYTFTADGSNKMELARLIKMRYP